MNTGAMYQDSGIIHVLCCCRCHLLVLARPNMTCILFVCAASIRLREEQEQLIRASRELLSRDVLSELSAKSGKSLKDKRLLDSAKANVHSELETSNRPAERRKAEPSVVDDGISDGREDGDRLSIMSEDSQDDISADVTDTCQRFVDLNSLSAGTRRAAAPHIYNIFEQVALYFDLSLNALLRLFAPVITFFATDLHGRLVSEYP
jgi:hypothetical protein